jgi:hypothetical protein
MEYKPVLYKAAEHSFFIHDEFVRLEGLQGYLGQWIITGIAPRYCVFNGIRILRFDFRIVFWMPTNA